ncbi:MAG TPA: hypothetical protein VJ911_03175 [Cryomorphaceae bacterium]|nr:hypothetical protein [Cryomorphaceae bacterium]
MDLNTPSLGIGARVRHDQFGEGIVVDFDEKSLEVFFISEGDKEISKNYPGLKIVESPRDTEPESLDLTDVESALRNVIQEFIEKPEPLELAKKWEGGTMVLKPANPELQSKEVPIDTFWHKIVMVRDRLRVLEQNINSHDQLSDGDKVQLQQYITRAYGSLTTFNILFAEKGDQFSSKG